MISILFVSNCSFILLLLEAGIAELAGVGGVKTVFYPGFPNYGLTQLFLTSITSFMSSLDESLRFRFVNVLLT